MFVPLTFTKAPGTGCPDDSVMTPVIVAACSAEMLKAIINKTAFRKLTTRFTTVKREGLDKIHVTFTGATDPQFSSEFDTKMRAL